MKNFLSNRLLLLVNLTDEQLLTPTYWVLVVVYLIVGAVLIHPGNHMSDMVKHLAIAGVIIGLARLFNSPLSKWAWAGFMILMLVLLVLDSAIAVLG